MPPLQWHMGRVAEIYPGEDVLVRVATVRTTTGTLKRAVKKLCPPPIDSEDKETIDSNIIWIIVALFINRYSNLK